MWCIFFWERGAKYFEYVYYLPLWFPVAGEIIWHDSWQRFEDMHLQLKLYLMM
jgi:hypothetical protein